jgi:hypothetical protein
MRRSGPFRATYSYCNPAFSTAVLAMERATGQSFEELLRSRLLEPLGMRATALGPPARNDPSRARGHTILRAGHLVEVDEDDDWARPGGGGLLSTLNDQARWLRFNLDCGHAGGRTILPASAWDELWQPHIFLPRAKRQLWMGDLDAPFVAYGLGWFLGTFAGQRMAAHSGGGIGWRTRNLLLPERGLGMCILLNTDGKAATMVQNRLLDLSLGGPDRNWHELVRANRRRTLQARKNWLDRDFPASGDPPLGEEAVCGSYHNPESGRLEISAGADGGLRFRLEDGPAFDGDLVPLGGPVFEHRLSGPFATYDGPDAPPPRLLLADVGARGAGSLLHSHLGPFARS